MFTLSWQLHDGYEHMYSSARRYGFVVKNYKSLLMVVKYTKVTGGRYSEKRK